MINKTIAVLLVLVGVINLLPVAGLVSDAKLTALYGVVLNDMNLSILMRHRALLFGLLGSLIIWSAFQPALRLAAIIGGLVSMLGFIGLAWYSGSYNELLARIVVADIIGSVLLLLLIALQVYSARKGD